MPAPAISPQVARYNCSMTTEHMDASAALRRDLNGETGRIAWADLQRHFARGVVIKVADDLDLVEVAARFAADDVAAVDGWLRERKVTRAGTDDAMAWQTRQAVFWAVVTAPWVLVQEIAPDMD